MRYQVIFVTSLLLMSACSTLSIDHQTISDNSTPAPTLAVECTAANVNFDRSNCIITIEVAHDGRTLRSKALPIHANSLQIMPILPNEHLGLGDMTNRNIKAWSVGQEEQSVDVAVEIAMLSDTPMLIVHQRYGFEHVSHAHTVFEITDDALETRLEARPSAQPEYIELWPETDGIIVRRTPMESSRSRTVRYATKRIGTDTQFVPINNTAK